MTMEQIKRFLKLRLVQERTGLGKSTIYRMANEGSFPKPLKLGPRASAWLESDITAWIDSKIEENSHAAV